MERKSRFNYSIINSIVGGSSQIISLLTGFILQTIFIKTLGATYLGVKGLFSNILSVLSFSELGIGTAITFSLYKPLAQDNKKQIAAIMRFFKHTYEVIGILVGVLGVILIPFINFFTHIRIPYLYIYYLLFLANTVISYFYTYERTLLNADQLNYINLTNQIVFKVIQVILQAVVLIVWNSFFWFLVIQLLCTFVSNVLISIQVHHKYPYLLDKQYANHKLPRTTLAEIFHNTIGLIGTKVADVIVMGSDNMLISLFNGLYNVGLYSNYTFIINGVMGVFSQATNTLSGSIGNLTAQEDNADHQYDVLKRSFFVVQFCTYFCAVCLFTLIDPFIHIWVGKRYEFAFLVTFSLVFNFIIMGLRQTFFPFVSAYGLYPKDGMKAFIEAIVNLVLSIVYAKFFKLGVAAIVLGTVSSNILVNWYEPYMIIKYGIKIKGKMLSFYLEYLSYILIDTIMMLLVHRLLSFYVVSSILSFAILTVITIIIALISFVILFGLNKNFKFLIYVIKNVLKKILRKI